MRINVLAVVLTSLCSLTAQSPVPAAPNTTPSDPLIAIKGKLTAALQKSATLTDTAFKAAWGPNKKKKKDDDAANEDPFTRMMGGGSHALTGSWHAGRLDIKFDGDQADELVLTGRRTIAKDDQTDWRLRAGRFADGNQIPFLPDVPALLQQLANWDLTVTQRSVTSLDDKPVEIVSMTLTPEQVAEATWAGLLPGSPQSSFQMFMGAAAAARRPTAQVPEATVDLAITFDPSTSIVQELRLRRWEKSGGMGGGRVVMVRAGGAVLGGGDDSDDEDEETAKPAENAPMTYENGLPVRPRKKQVVSDFSVRLLNHGQTPAVELSPEQKRLLGL